MNDDYNNHSRPWEKLPEGVLNLLALHSLYSTWDEQLSNWRIYHERDDEREYISVEFGCTLEDWIAAVNALLAP